MNVWFFFCMSSACLSWFLFHHMNIYFSPHIYIYIYTYTYIFIQISHFFLVSLSQIIIYLFHRNVVGHDPPAWNDLFKKMTTITMMMLLLLCSIIMYLCTSITSIIALDNTILYDINFSRLVSSRHDLTWYSIALPSRKHTYTYYILHTTTPHSTLTCDYHTCT